MTRRPSPSEALRRIAALYAIEADIRGTPAENRRSQRQSAQPARWSRPMQAWLTVTDASASPAARRLAQAMRYALEPLAWPDADILDDGRLELDTNTVERAMRPVALGRKNALVRRRRQRGPALGDHRLADPDGEAQ